LNLNQPLVSGVNNAVIYEYDLLGNNINEVGITVLDNGLTQTYIQTNSSNGNPKPILIPPGYKLAINVHNGYVFPYGMLLLGTLDEIVMVAIR
jgi:hypothetical protein